MESFATQSATRAMTHLFRREEVGHAEAVLQQKCKPKGIVPLALSASFVVFLVAGCVSPLNRTTGRAGTDYASAAKPGPGGAVVPDPDAAELNLSVETPKTLTTATTHKPVAAETYGGELVVRNQNGSAQFGGLSQVVHETSQQPMAVSGQSTSQPMGQASRIPTTSNGYVTPTQFTNPELVAQGSQAWATPQPTLSQQTQQYGTSVPASSYQAPPPTGYPGAPGYVGPSSPQSVAPPQTPGYPQGAIPQQIPTPQAASAQMSPVSPVQTPTSFANATPSPASAANATTQTVPAQPGSNPYSGQPAIGGWPQAFGQPQPPTPPGGLVPPSTRFADLMVNVQETQTGRFMVGAAVNSDAGVTGQIVIDEQNFDWRRWPRSLDDALNGGAFRGGGQRLRIEALPGDKVQRYMVQFTEPYLAGTRVSMNLSGYYFDRRYYDWDENRLGARAGLGYRISPDLSLAGGIRAERVKVTNPRLGAGVVAELDEALGKSELYSGNVSLTHDTRDVTFAPTQGHYLRFSYDQAFGTFDYGRGEVDWRRYFLVTERPDGSGRHVLGFSNRFSLSGHETPIYENYFAGGHATLRGFEFRGASPEDATVKVGGRMMFLGSVEYLFPITADDMLKGVVFCDYGTVEEDAHIEWDDFRVALGAGLRVSIAAMGPAPIALDFAVPVSREGTDDIQNFSFFVGVSR